MLFQTQTPEKRVKRERARREAKPSNHRPNGTTPTPNRIAKIAPLQPSRSNFRHFNLVATWSLPPLVQSCHPWPTYDQSLSFSIYLSLSLSFRSLSLPPSLSLTEFFSLTNNFFLIIFSLSLYIEIFYYKIFLEAEKMWETSRKIAFSECNQTPENIFQNNFHNVAKHLKIFSFPKNIFTWKYFTCYQTQPKMKILMIWHESFDIYIYKAF